MVCGAGRPGVRREDLDLSRTKSLTVSKQLVQIGREIEESTPKSDVGERVIALDELNVALLRAFRLRQRAEAFGVRTGVRRFRAGVHQRGRHVSAPELGVSDRFERLVAEAGLPPIRLHDLRHGAATLLRASGADDSTVQRTLGHHSVSFTTDNYGVVLKEVQRAAAEGAVALVPRATGTFGLTSASHDALGADPDPRGDRAAVNETAGRKA